MQVTNCRMCQGKDLYTFLDLGYHPHSDQFRKTNDEPETRYPLKVMMCRDCGLAQLSYIVEKEVMYTEDYLYEASITATADKHWADLADDVITMAGITNGVSVDIGGNDGTLALKFKERGFDAINVDPCKEVTDISKNRGVKTINNFFNKDAVDAIGKADIITGTNVFAHIHDLDTFMRDVVSLMKKDSIFVFESPYLADFLDGLEYDTVYHQHLSYLSLKPLVRFLSKFGLEVFDAKRTPLHGGGFRVFICHEGARSISPEVTKILASENFTETELMTWGEKCKKHRDEIHDFVSALYKDGKTIACVSAPAKGMTFLNYTDIGKYISFITEKSKLKIGRYTPGTKMQIKGDEELIKKQPNYALILAWNFADEIIKNNPTYEGTWIIALPTIRTIAAK